MAEKKRQKTRSAKVSPTMQTVIHPTEPYADGIPLVETGPLESFDVTGDRNR